MPVDSAIGVFDSGVGGISVLREIRALLPHEDLLYVADSGHCPYGSKSESYIHERSLGISRWLLEQGSKCIVVACNTATAAAATTLRATFDAPIVAMEPAIKPAVAATRSGVVGVLATVGTARSERLTALIERFGRGVQILTQPCPGLVERSKQATSMGRERAPSSSATSSHFWQEAPIRSCLAARIIPSSGRSLPTLRVLMLP